MAASVAGCVGMPNSGSPGTFGATPQDTTPDSNFIGAIPLGPQANWSPVEIVAGFLNASASYPVYTGDRPAVPGQRGQQDLEPGLVGPGGRSGQAARARRDEPGGRQATVDVTGSVQASFSGTGQYVGAQQSHGEAPAADQQFKLVKVNGQWRITNPPNFRMLTEPDFSQVYRPQDLYFFDPAGQVLVPDAVFVPTGTSPQSLVSNLVGALLNDPQPRWLQTWRPRLPP